MKVSFTLLLVGFAMAQTKYNIINYDLVSVKMWEFPSNIMAKSVTLTYHTCYGQNDTVSRTFDPELYWGLQRRAYLQMVVDWTPGFTINKNWLCVACFDTPVRSRLSRGDMGVGWCSNKTSSVVGDLYPWGGTIKAHGHRNFEFLEDEGQGWNKKFNFEYDLAAFYSTSFTMTTMNIYSNDFNDGGDAKALGFSMENDRLIKCYAGGSVTGPFDPIGDISMVGWDTAEAVFLDLAYMAQASNLLIGLTTTSIAILSLF
jgi:hypothetical protein